MIGLFGSQTGCHRTNSPSTAYKSKSKATTNLLLDNQINDKLKEVNNNLIKKRPHFLKFFHENFFKANSIEDESPKSSSCMRWVLIMYGSQLSSTLECIPILIIVVIFTLHKHLFATIVDVVSWTFPMTCGVLIRIHCMPYKIRKNGKSFNAQESD